MINSPAKNEGNDIAANAPIVTAESKNEYCLVAEMTPITIAISQVNKVEADAIKRNSRCTD